MRILVVEDERDLNRILTKTLTKAGYTVDGCFDGEEVVAEIHVGVEDPFHPARKAHPALVVDSPEELEAMAARIEAGGFELSWSERTTFPGYLRFHARDGAGNRIEVLTPC